MDLHNIEQEALVKTIHKNKKLKKGKMVVWGSLKNSWERREVKGKGEEEKYTHLNAEFQRIARWEKTAFLIEQYKQKKTIEWEKLEISLRKLKIPREHFMQRWAQ